MKIGCRKITKEVIVSKGLLCILLVIASLVLLVVGCTKPLTVTIYEPKDVATVDKSPVEVRGTVSDAKATVWVNDTIVAVTKAKTGGRGNFSTNVDLNEGDNTINVVAARGKEGDWKEVVDKTVTVTYSPKA